MKPNKWIIILIILLMTIFVATCAPQKEVVTVIVQVTFTPQPASNNPTAVSEPTLSPTVTSPPRASSTPRPTKTAKPSFMDCWKADSYAGNTVTCQIDRAYCSFRPDIGGSPTYCNDAPYPSHSFTLLVWGSDWSDYDGKCLIVEGFVSRYNGKPQIVAEYRSQVSKCP